MNIQTLCTLTNFADFKQAVDEQYSEARWLLYECCFYKMATCEVEPVSGRVFLRDEDALLCEMVDGTEQVFALDFLPWATVASFDVAETVLPQDYYTLLHAILDDLTFDGPEEQGQLQLQKLLARKKEACPYEPS